MIVDKKEFFMYNKRRKRMKAMKKNKSEMDLLTLTNHALTIIDIIKDDERFIDRYELLNYTPEFNYTLTAKIEGVEMLEHWTVFEAIDIKTNSLKFLCYSSEDRLESRDLEYLRKRIKKAEKEGQRTLEFLRKSMKGEI